VLISVDTLRQDALGCYGNTEVRTPHVDALARDGVLFREAWSHAPSTLPSHASMFFSELPWRLGVLRNGDTLPARGDSLASVLRSRGYATAAFTSLAVLDASFGLAQGFDHYDDEVARDPERPYRFADEVNAALLPWLAAQRQPFFAFVHYQDPHEPYAHRQAPPDVEASLNGRPVGRLRFLLRERERLELELPPGRSLLLLRALGSARGPRAPRYGLVEVRAEPAAVRVEADLAAESAEALGVALYNPGKRPLPTRVFVRGRVALSRADQKREYLREVEWVDAAIGALVAALRERGLYENTVIALVADHGEGLGDHGTMGHETQVYASQLRIPMILVDHRRKGVEHAQTATLADLAPTLLSLVGGSRPASWRGEDLTRAGGSREVLAATFFGRDPATPTHRRLSVLRAPHHLIFSLPAERTELFDLSSDPGERRDLLDGTAPPPAFEGLQRSLQDLVRDVDLRLRERRATSLSAEQLERLRALGYLGGADEP
jgi:arylsulfatase A-like enzyme